jgi:hypothetical protein
MDGHLHPFDPARNRSPAGLSYHRNQLKQAIRLREYHPLVSLDSRAALLLLAHGVVTCLKPPGHREVNVGFSRAAPAGVAVLRPAVIKPMVAVSDDPYVARQLLGGESAPVRV